jgi:hypothetical protein
MPRLIATADPGFRGQYIARIVGAVGADLIRRFVGEDQDGQTVADVDSPGLYELCDVTRERGAICRYEFVADVGGRQMSIGVCRGKAMQIAKAISQGRRMTVFCDDGEGVARVSISARELGEP